MILWRGTKTGEQEITPEAQAELDRLRAEYPDPSPNPTARCRICGAWAELAYGMTRCACGAVTKEGA